MPKNTRNDRNNPYLIEGLMVDFHRSKAGIAWRWRIELAILTTTLAAFWRLAILITATWSAVTLAGLVVIVLAVPHSRRFITRRTWCVISRHRLQRVFYETRMHTRAGRLPLILWIRPTRVGERAWIMCRAGVCADDFDAYKAEIGSACYGREARVIRHKKHSNLVTLDIVRHDPLTADVIIPSRIPRPPTASTTGQSTSSDVIEPTTVIPPTGKVTEPVA